VTEESSAGQWNRGEVYDGGKHLAPYNHWKTYFIAADALGTENLRSTLDGTSYESCTNMPFGDDLTCTGPEAGNVNPLHSATSIYSASQPIGIQRRQSRPHKLTEREF
jgi:hypothetical protein